MRHIYGCLDNTASSDSQQDAGANGAQQSYIENVIKDGHQPIREVLTSLKDKL